MRDRHGRSGPEGEEPAHVQRVSHKFVESGCLEGKSSLLFSQQIESHLPQSEQVEVVNEERGRQHQEPSKGKQRQQHTGSESVEVVSYSP